MTRLFVTPINIVLGALILVAAATGFVTIPSGTLLPVQWGLDLRPETWQPREIALLVGPALAIAVGVLLALLRLYGSRARSERAGPVIRIAFTSLLLLALALEAAIVWSGLAAIPAGAAP